MPADFHRRIAARVEAFEGVSKIRFIPLGAPGSYARHPHLAISLTNGVVFDKTLRGRPIDGCADYFKTILADVRRQVREHLGEEAPKPIPTVRRKFKRHKSRRWAPAPVFDELFQPVPNITYCGPPVSTAPSPFAVLADLTIKMSTT